MNDDVLTIYDRFEKPGEMILRLGEAILHSKMFGCQNASQGQILALECAARRCPPMSLAERYHIIHGRLSMRSDAMLAEFRSRCGGNHRIVERSADKAAIVLTVGSHSQEFWFSWADATQEPFVYVGKEAEIVRKLKSGKTDELVISAKYATPRSRMQMLWARVVSDGVRAMAPEVVCGHYAPEEIEDSELSTLDKDSQPANPSEEFVVKPTSVTLSGTANESEQPLNAPCGDAVAEQIKKAAQAAGVSAEKLASILQEKGVNKVAELPAADADVLLARMEIKAQDNNNPFG